MAEHPSPHIAICTGAVIALFPTSCPPVGTLAMEFQAWRPGPTHAGAARV